ncbi:hypothetical protein PHYC_00013 [Phycisphaerales bacterium]|nr:hypothetical protein PHYC_00013 [Phycisphaerales bacterium]
MIRFLIAAWSFAAASALGQPLQLFTPAAWSGRPADDTPTIRARAVNVDAKLLTNCTLQSGESLSLQLFDDLAVTGLVRDAHDELGFRVLRGDLPAEPEGEFLFVMGRGVMTGEIRSARLGAFEIRYLRDTIHLVREIDNRGWKTCACGQEHEINAGGGAPGYSERGTPIIRSLIVYTAQARDAEGGEAAIQARAVFAIAQANTVYVNSQADVQVELAYTGLIDYVESNNASTDLGRFRSTTDNIMDEVHCIRNAMGADACSLLVSSFNACGIAYLMTNPGPNFHTSAFSVTDKDCIGGYTWAHELGHNMGCAHDRDNAGAAAYSYAYGYRTPDQVYRTVMAYSPGTRIGRFSNPDITYNGYAMGIPLGQTGETYNALCITNTAPIMSNFRGAPQSPADFNDDGAVNGFDVECVEQAVNGDIGCSPNDPDINQDGALNGFDIEAMEQLVNGGGCL